MEALYEKMKEYVKMEDEISTQEFCQYFQEVVDHLMTDFDGMDQEMLLKSKLVTAILAGNSANRKSRKDGDMKKFKKMHEKSLFWTNAIEYRLKNLGMTAKEIEEKTNEMEAAM